MPESIEPERWYVRDAVVTEVNIYEREQTCQSHDLGQPVLLQVQST